jgi:hypothetical protein
MKFLSKLLCIVALGAIGSVSAKTISGGGAAAPQRREVPEQRMPQGPKQSYQQIHDKIIAGNFNPTFTGDKLNPTFIGNLGLQTSAAGLDITAFRNLLRTARDKFAPFIGNDAQDLTTLKAINQQINTAQL